VSSSKVICSLRLDPRLRRYLDAIADQRQLSFNSLVAMTLAEYWRFDPRRAGHVGGEDVEVASPPAPSGASKAASVVGSESVARIGRNAPCPCGSGQKDKRCCANGPPVP
jgi:hypothetical protein